MGGVAQSEEGTKMIPQTTMLNLVSTVSELTPSEAEVIATVVHMVNTGKVELIGCFRGRRFDLDLVAPRA
jgi:hypothetical protein